jgi:serine/threonine protein kinase
MPLADQKLGPYLILSPLGRGGMGEVWRARDSRLGRDVAIKISDQQFSDRFEREARAIAALNHPNICRIHDVGQNDRATFRWKDNAHGGKQKVMTVSSHEFLRRFKALGQRKFQRWASRMPPKCQAPRRESRRRCSRLAHAASRGVLRAPREIQIHRERGAGI